MEGAVCRRSGAGRGGALEGEETPSSATETRETEQNNKATGLSAPLSEGPSPLAVVFGWCSRDHGPVSLCGCEGDRERALECRWNGMDI